MIDKNFECRHKNFYHCDFDDNGNCKNCDRITSNPEKLKAEIKTMILNQSKSNMIDDQLFIDALANTWEKHNVRLEHAEIQQLCDIYFQSGEQSAQRLNQADNLFRQLDHFNAMLIAPVNETNNEDKVRLGYV